MTDHEPATVTYEAIGVVRSPFTSREGMPLQSVAAQDVHGTIEVYPRHAAALKDLDGFSHAWVVSHLHRSTPSTDSVVLPFLDDVERGVFATRSPRHPNPIGLSVVRLLRIEAATLHVEGLDLLDGTPVLDLKPYVPLFDCIDAERIGWLTHRAESVHTVRADRRFESESEHAPDNSSSARDPGTAAKKKRWHVMSADGSEHHQRAGTLLATEGKALSIGDLLTLPPDTEMRWIVVDVRDDPHDDDSGIAVVEALGVRRRR